MLWVEDIPQRLYNSEINFSIQSFWDGGFQVKLGDHHNDWEAETNTDSYLEALVWLDKMAKHHYPKSQYAKESHG